MEIGRNRIARILFMLALGWVLSMCTTTEGTTPDDASHVDAGRMTDGASMTDAHSPPGDASHDGSTGPSDGNPGDAPSLPEDAYIPPMPCTPATSGAPGELICTGIRYTGSDPDVTATVIDGTVRAPTGVFLDGGDVYIQTPLLLGPNCFGLGMPPVLSAPRTGSFMIEVSIDGTVRPFTLNITDLVLDDSTAGDETTAWLNHLHDMLASSPDPDTLAIANDLMIASGGITSALTTPIPMLGFGSSGCIPSYSCCVISTNMDRYGITVMDAYLRNVRLSARSIGPHTLTDPPSFDIGVCSANWRSAAYCTLGFAGLAVLKAGEGAWGDSVLAATGTVIYAGTAIGLGVKAAIGAALTLPHWVATNLSIAISTVTSTVQNVVTRGLNVGTDAACSALRRLWRTTWDDARVDCSACTVTRQGDCGGGCMSDTLGDCGCGGNQRGCTGYASGGGYCTAYCLMPMVCVTFQCSYAASALEDDDGSPHGCPSRCSGTACPGLTF